MKKKSGGVYEITVGGRLGLQWKAWFEGMEIAYSGENTVLIGLINDQAMLHGVLNQIRDLNMTLISVKILNNK